MRVRGTTRGGVLLPGFMGPPPNVGEPAHGILSPEEIEEEEDHTKPRFAPVRFEGAPPFSRGGACGGVATPEFGLGEGTNRKASTLVWWVPCPLNADYFVVPLVCQMAAEVGYARVIGPGGGDLLTRYGKGGSTPQVRIGWRATEPKVEEWTEFNRAKEVEDFQVNGGAGPIEMALLPEKFSPDLAFDLSPLLWHEAARPRDCLMVAEGNYTPRPGDYLYSVVKAELEAIRAFEKGLSEAALAFLREHEGEGESALNFQDGLEAATFGTLVGLYKKWEKEWEQLEGMVGYCLPPNGLGGAPPPYRTVEEQEEIEAAEAAIRETVEESQALPPYVDLMGAEQAAREAQGPFMNGVKRWAYRFNLHKPPGGLPDLTKTGGFLTIEFSSGSEDNFGRWFGKEAGLVGSFAFDWPINGGPFGVGPGSSIYGLADQPADADGMFEIQRHVGTPSEVHVGLPATGRAAPRAVRGVQTPYAPRFTI